MPIRVIAVETTDARKNVHADRIAPRSPCRRPTRAIDGNDNSSSATISVTRSRAVTMSSAPAAALSSRKWYSPGGIAFSKFMTVDATTTNRVPSRTTSDRANEYCGPSARNSSIVATTRAIADGSSEPSQVRRE